MPLNPKPCINPFPTPELAGCATAEGLGGRAPGGHHPASPPQGPGHRETRCGSRGGLPLRVAAAPPRDTASVSRVYPKPPSSLAPGSLGHPMKCCSWCRGPGCLRADARHDHAGVFWWVSGLGTPYWLAPPRSSALQRSLSTCRGRRLWQPRARPGQGWGAWGEAAHTGAPTTEAEAPQVWRAGVQNGLAGRKSRHRRRQCLWRLRSSCLPDFPASRSFHMAPHSHLCSTVLSPFL